MDELMDVAVEDEAYMDMDDYETDEITQEDAWVVIDKYFKEKGLVGQQIDSFDEFVINTIQELIEDAGEITVTPENQYLPGQDSEMVSFFLRHPVVFALVRPALIFPHLFLRNFSTHTRSNSIKCMCQSL